MSGIAVDRIRLPRKARAPLAAVGRRVSRAAARVVFVAVVVVVGRDGYVDVTGTPIGLVDAFYYASVTVTTTGYGDISAVSSGARLATILLITPARIMFLILVVSTTVEVLTEQSREMLVTRRWRQRVRDHIVICGFGSTGQAALADLLSRGVSVDDIVVVDADPAMIAIAERRGVVAVEGNAAQNEVLEQAGISQARAVIVTPGRDDTAVLVTLTVREMNPDAHLVAGGNEQENLHLLRQGGADEVVDATAAVGRMLGLGTVVPNAVEVVDDLLDARSGFEMIEVEPTTGDHGLTVPSSVTLVAVVRDGERLRPSEIDTESLLPGDRLLVLREH